MSSTAHGHRVNGNRSKTYKAWENMKNRCNNPNYRAYDRYGGRGICVCEEWDKSYVAFLEHMGEHPGEGYTLDRIDSDGNYEPGNVRWATWFEQAETRGPRPNKTTGAACVYVSGNRFAVNIVRKKIRYHVGSFATVEEAVIARDKAIEEIMRGNK